MITYLKARFSQARSEESAFTTAELLGNAALGIVGLVAIWGALKALGLNVVDWIGTKMMSGN